MTKRVSLTYFELRTIIEDAFIDGWNTQDDDWVGAEAFLRLHKQYGESCDTTKAIDDLIEEAKAAGEPYDFKTGLEAGC